MDQSAMLFKLHLRNFSQNCVPPQFEMELGVPFCVTTWTQCTHTKEKSYITITLNWYTKLQACSLLSQVNLQIKAWILEPCSYLGEAAEQQDEIIHYGNKIKTSSAAWNKINGNHTISFEKHSVHGQQGRSPEGNQHKAYRCCGYTNIRMWVATLEANTHTHKKKKNNADIVLSVGVLDTHSLGLGRPARVPFRQLRKGGLGSLWRTPPCCPTPGCGSRGGR